MMKKMLCLALCLALISGLALPAHADQTTIYELLDAAEQENYEECNDADDQMAVGTRYLLKLTAIALERMDTQGLLTEQVKTVLTQNAADDARCANSAQRVAASLYATCDLLALAAALLDDGTHTAAIQAALKELDSFCLTSQDQQAVAANVMFRLCAILARELDTTAVWEAKICELEAGHEASAKQAKGRLHDTANSLYRSAGMLSIIDLQTDWQGRWEESISNVQSSLEEMDQVCVSSVHQCVNGCFRCMELMAIWALELQ